MLRAWQDLKKLPRELWLLCLATLVNRMGTMALPFLVLYFTRSLGFSTARAGGMMAIYGLTALLVGPIAGRLCDRWGAYRLMELTLVSSGIVLILFPFAKSFWSVLFMTILFAATNEAFRPANMALVGKLGPAQQRKAAFALMRLAVNLGMSVGPAAGGFLVHHSFQLLFLVDGATTLIAVGILMLTSFRKTIMKQEEDLRAAQEAQSNRENDGWLLKAFFTDPALRIFLLGILPVAAVFFQHVSAMPLYLVRDLHFAESDYGMLFALNTLLIITLEIPLNSMTSHWSYRRTLTLGSILFALGFGGLAFANSFLEVALTIVVWSFGEMVLFPSMSAYVSEIAPKDRHGEYMGLYVMTFSLAFLVGPWAGTTVLEHFGSKTLWISTFVVGLLSALVLGRPSNAKNAPIAAQSS